MLVGLSVIDAMLGGLFEMLTLLLLEEVARDNGDLEADRLLPHSLFANHVEPSQQ